MEQNKQELSELVQKDESFSNVVGNALKKTGKFLYQTIRQSPDADILLAGYVASYFVPELEDVRSLFGFFAIKQYIWGHWSYNDAKRQLNKTRNVSEKAFEKTFSPWGFAGPCSYCGSRYALSEHKRQMTDNI
jgi:hypothetical protein